MANSILCMSFSIVISVFILEIINVSNAQMVPAMFAFGDSLIDVGNNNYLPRTYIKANFPHNGVDFPTKMPTGRFSNGMNPADLLALKVGLPLSPPYLSLSLHNPISFMTGVSFASGGSGIFNSSDETLGTAVPLSQQVEYYEAVYEALVGEMGPAVAQNHTSKSLFFVVEGNNDLFDYFGSSDLQKQYTPLQYVDLMATTLKGFIKRLYASSARKFVFSGIGPLGCVPFKRAGNATGGCDERLNSVAVLYNQRLKAMLPELKSELTGFSYTYFEGYSIFEKIIQSASSYGFTETKEACCGLGNLGAEITCLPISTLCSNRSEYIYWDPYHPTQATNAILVDAMFDGPLDVSFPMNVRQLVAA